MVFFKAFSNAILFDVFFIYVCIPKYCRLLIGIGKVGSHFGSYFFILCKDDSVSSGFRVARLQNQGSLMWRSEIRRLNI